MNGVRMPHFLALCIALIFSASAWSADGPGATRVAKWKDDKQAAFILMFDDSCQSHVKNAIPAYTVHGQFSGPGLGTQWSNPNTRSAFLASFSY